MHACIFGDMDPRELLRRLMEARGLNPHSLAAATRNRTKQPQIYRFLHGTAKEPRRSTLEPVAEVFGVPVEAFYDPAEASRVWLVISASSNGLPAPSLAPKPTPPPTLAEALPIVLACLAGLDDYTADQVLGAMRAAMRPSPPLSRIERDLLLWLEAKPQADANNHPAAPSWKRRNAA